MPYTDGRAAINAAPIIIVRFEAVARGDKIGAVAQMREHLDNLESRLVLDEARGESHNLGCWSAFRRALKVAWREAPASTAS
jgi:hypothetical protein